MNKELNYKIIEKVIDYLKLSNEKICWVYKGEKELEDVTITEEYTYDYKTCILNGSKFNGMLIVKNDGGVEKESPLYFNKYNYIDKRTFYNEYGQDINRNNSSKSLISYHLNDLYVFCVFNNFVNNKCVNYKIEYYYIK